jgi:hypothetical protein
LYLPLPAERQDTVARGDYGEWLLRYIDACFQVALDLGCGVERMEDIVLISGCHLAESWVNVAFSENRGGTRVSFGVRTSGNSGVHFDEWNMSGRGLKLGPSGQVGLYMNFHFLSVLKQVLKTIARLVAFQNLPQNQCIFVRGFRVVRLLNVWPKLRAAGPTPDLGQPGPESDRYLELISIPATDDVRRSCQSCSNIR